VWYVAKHGAAQSPGLSGLLGLNWLLCEVQKMKIAQESCLGCDTIEDTERATNCFISALVVANHSLVRLCDGELGLSLLY